MKQKIISLFLLLSLAMPIHAELANQALPHDIINDVDINALDAELDHSLVYIEKDARESIVALENLLPDYQWSSLFKKLCLDLREEGNVALYEHVDQVVSECLTACKTLSNDQIRTIQAQLETYQKQLLAGKAYLSALEDDQDQATTRSSCCSSSCSSSCCPKTKRYSRLCVSTLSVCRFFVNHIDYSNLTTLGNALPAASFVGLTGATGTTGVSPTGATGATGAAGSAGGVSAYGYIYNLTAQAVAINAPVLFDSNGPLLGITHTPGSDSIVITDAGTYAIFFSASGAEVSQFAIAVNGTPQASTRYGSGAGTQQNTGLSIVTLAATDTLTLVSNSSTAAVSLSTPIGGTAGNVNAAVLIIRLA